MVYILLILVYKGTGNISIFTVNAKKLCKRKRTMSEKNKRRKASWKRLKGTTNFYPKYVDGNLDKVTPTAATYSTEFQTIIPRYNLSMSETRNYGTGPTFLETEYQPPSENQDPEKKSAKSPRKSPEPLIKLSRNKKKKIRTDFWE